jgi:hypothetical protein
MYVLLIILRMVQDIIEACAANVVNLVRQKSLYTYGRKQAIKSKIIVFFVDSKVNTLHK